MRPMQGMLKSAIKTARRRDALWVRLFDPARLLTTAEGRARLWTGIVHSRVVHQTTPYTRDERYPALFDLAAALVPDATRILSFGCSTGEELVALRRRFADAEIVGAEINARSRRIAARRTSNEPRSIVVHPNAVYGTFDLVFALAVLQREPHKIAEMGVEDLSRYYPFERFDGTVRQLTDSLRPDGLLCVANAQYRVEDSSVANQLEPIGVAPLMKAPLFGPDGLRLGRTVASTMFRKRCGV